MSATALFREHAHFVASFLVRLGVRSSEVDDLVQDVFMVVHQKGGYVPGAARPTTWLAAIATHVAGNARRSERRSKVEYDQEHVEVALDHGVSAAEAIESAEAGQRVRRALDALDLGLRAVLVLYELEGESCDAIAAGLGVPVGTVYSRLNTARRRLREAYERYEHCDRQARFAPARQVSLREL